jgi:hypothetical protein
MVYVEHADFLMFGGSSDPCAMIQIESIGGDASTLMGPLTEVRAEKEHNNMLKTSYYKGVFNKSVYLCRHICVATSI